MGQKQTSEEKVDHIVQAPSATLSKTESKPKRKRDSRKLPIFLKLIFIRREICSRKQTNRGQNTAQSNAFTIYKKRSCQCT